MFGYLFVLFLAIYVADRAAWMLWSRDAEDETGAITERNRDPLGYWAIAGTWCVAAAALVAGVVALTWFAATGSGPYKDHAFFSMYQAWPLGLLVIPGGAWVAWRAVKFWRLVLRR